MGEREELVRQRLWHLNPKEQTALSRLLNREIEQPETPISMEDSVTLRTVRSKLEKLKLIPFTKKHGIKQGRDRK